MTKDIVKDVAQIESTERCPICGAFLTEQEDSNGDLVQTCTQCGWSSEWED